MIPTPPADKPFKMERKYTTIMRVQIGFSYPDIETVSVAELMKMEDIISDLADELRTFARNKTRSTPGLKHVRVRMEEIP